MAKQRNHTLVATLTTLSTSSGAMGLLATSFMTTWSSLAVTSRINHKICDKDHGTASLEISLSLIASMTRYKVEVPRITGHSDNSGSSITKVTWSSSYPWTQGTLTFIKTNPIGSTRLPPIPLIRGAVPQSLEPTSPGT